MKEAYKEWKRKKGPNRLNIFRREKGAVKFLKKAIKKNKRLRRVWGGSKHIMVNEVRPVAERFGLPRTSSKRLASDPLTVLNPGSDHSVLSTKSFADDYGTFDGSAFAHAVAEELGIENYSTGNYNAYYIVRNKKTYRVQILWAVEAHFNHVHVGIKLEG